MTSMVPRYVEVPPMLTSSTKNFSYWKKLMVSFLILIDVWEVVENAFTPEYDKTTNIITTYLD